MIVAQYNTVGAVVQSDTPINSVSGAAVNIPAAGALDNGEDRKNEAKRLASDALMTAVLAALTAASIPIPAQI